MDLLQEKLRLKYKESASNNLNTRPTRKTYSTRRCTISLLTRILEL